MATLSSQLILSLVDRVTAPARGVAGAISNMQSKLEANNQRLDAMRGRLVETGVVAWGLANAIKAPVQAAIEFESAMADVRKVVDFPTPASFEQMSADIIKMSTEIPIAATGIADIVAAAGQAGMAGDELLGFTEIAAKVGVAFDMTAGDVGTALAKIKTQLQLSVADTGALADAINHLSNTSASEAPSIVDFMRSVAATGEQYGFTATETAAIGSAMIAAGAQADVAATSFRNVGRALAKGNTATERQAHAFSQLGLNVVDVAKRFNEDAVGTLRDVITRINGLPEHLRSNALSEIFGDEARALAPLVTNIKLYDDALASVAQQRNYLGSSEKEYQARAATTANSMQLFTNKLTAAGIAIGEALLPALNQVMDSLSPVVLAIAEFAKNNPRLTQTIVALTAGLVALRVAAIAAQFGFLWMRGAFLATAIASLRSAQFAIAGLSSAMGLMSGKAKAAQVAFSLTDQAATKAAASAKASQAMIAGMSGAQKLKDIRSAVKGMTLGNQRLASSATEAAASMRLVQGMSVGLTAAATGIGAISAPIVAAAAAIAAAGVLIYKYWEPISEFFIGFGTVIGNALSGAATAVGEFGMQIARALGIEGLVQPALDAVSQFGAMIGQAFSSIASSVGSFFADIFTMNDYSAQAEGEFRSVGERAARALVDQITYVPRQIADMFAGLSDAISGKISPIDFLSKFVNPVPGILGWFSGLAQSILDKIGSINIASLIDVSGIASKVANAVKGAASSAASSVSGAVSGAYNYITGGGEDAENRYVGGPVRAGNPYIVGERGPELFVPQTSGQVITARDTAAMVKNATQSVPKPRPIITPEARALPQPRAMPTARGARGGDTRQASAPNITFGNIIVQGGSNASAADLRREFGREASALMRSNYGDVV